MKWASGQKTTVHEWLALGFKTKLSTIMVNNIVQVIDTIYRNGFLKKSLFYGTYS